MTTSSTQNSGQLVLESVVQQLQIKGIAPADFFESVTSDGSTTVSRAECDVAFKRHGIKVSGHELSLLLTFFYKSGQDRYKLSLKDIFKQIADVNVKGTNKISANATPTPKDRTPAIPSRTERPLPKNRRADRLLWAIYTALRDQRVSIKEFLRRADTHYNRRIQKRGLQTALAALRVEGSERDVDDLIAVLGEEQAGTMTFGELGEALTKTGHAQHIMGRDTSERGEAVTVRLDEDKADLDVDHALLEAHVFEQMRDRGVKEELISKLHLRRYEGSSLAGIYGGNESQMEYLQVVLNEKPLQPVSKGLRGGRHNLYDMDSSSRWGQKRHNESMKSTSETQAKASNDKLTSIQESEAEEEVSHVPPMIIIRRASAQASKDVSEQIISEEQPEYIWTIEGVLWAKKLLELKVLSRAPEAPRVPVSLSQLAVLEQKLGSTKAGIQAGYIEAAAAMQPEPEKTRRGSCGSLFDSGSSDESLDDDEAEKTQPDKIGPEYRLQFALTLMQEEVEAGQLSDQEEEAPPVERWSAVSRQYDLSPGRGRHAPPCSGERFQQRVQTLMLRFPELTHDQVMEALDDCDGHAGKALVHLEKVRLRQAEEAANAQDIAKKTAKTKILSKTDVARRLVQERRSARLPDVQIEHVERVVVKLDCDASEGPLSTQSTALPPQFLWDDTLDSPLLSPKSPSAADAKQVGETLCRAASLSASDIRMLFKTVEAKTATFGASDAKHRDLHVAVNEALDRVQDDEEAEYYKFVRSASRRTAEPRGGVNRPTASMKMKIRSIHNHINKDIAKEHCKKDLLDVHLQLQEEYSQAIADTWTPDEALQRKHRLRGRQGVKS